MSHIKFNENTVKSLLTIISPEGIFRVALCVCVCVESRHFMSKVKTCWGSGGWLGLEAGAALLCRHPRSQKGLSHHREPLKPRTNTVSFFPDAPKSSREGEKVVALTMEDTFL